MDLTALLLSGTTRTICSALPAPTNRLGQPWGHLEGIAFTHLSHGRAAPRFTAAGQSTWRRVAERLGKNCDEGLRSGLTSFETRPLGAPQDEDKLLMALTRFLILRRPRSGRLEGRGAPLQLIGDFLPSRCEPSH
jgi:hypothetical protein